MDHLPIFLDVRDKRVLVVGEGIAAQRRAETLAKAGARVTVFAHEPRAEDFSGAALCIVATGDAEADARIHALAKAGIDTNKFPTEHVRKALDTCRGKIKTFSELKDYAGFYFIENPTIPADAYQKVFTQGVDSKLQPLVNRFEMVSQQDFTASYAEQSLKQVSGELHVKPKELVHPCRLAISGSYAGPSLYHALEVLGRDESVRRIKDAMQHIPPSGIAPGF